MFFVFCIVSTSIGYACVQSDIRHDLYFAVGDTERIIVDLTDEESDYVEIIVEGSRSNMSYDSDGFYYADLVSAVPIDETYEILDEGVGCGIVNARWRVPFDVEIQLWEYKGNDTSEVKAIKKSNMFIGLKPRHSVFTGNQWGQIGAFKFGGKTIAYDESEAYWGAYTNGKATITLYEPDEYSMYTLNVPINPTDYTGSEFYFPKINGMDKVKMATIYDVNSTNNNFDVYFSPLEKNISYGFDYMFKMAFAFCLWLAFMILLAYMIPNANVLIAIGIPTFLITIGAVNWIW